MANPFLRPLDVHKVLVGALCASALFALTMFAAGRVPYPTKHLSDPSVPYTFDYPGDFKKDDQADLPPDARRSLAFLTGISRGNEGGVLLGAFVPADPERVVSAVRDQFARFGGSVTGEKRVAAGGIEGIELQAVSTELDLRDRTIILFASPTLAYWIKCVGRAGGKDDADKACDKVLGSFEITTPDAKPGGPPRVPGVAA